ncbi:MAG: acyltransferase domain-containing protein [Acidimicrobiales bacterium]
MSETTSAMREFWPEPSRLASERVENFEVGDVAAVLNAIGFSAPHIGEITSHWREAQASNEWSALLAAGCTMVANDRGNIDRPLLIWSDMDDQGDVGRLFYFYLAALCYDDTLAYLRAHATPENVIDATMNILLQHTATHERKRGTLGFDAGWWSLLVWRAELLAIGSLEFHHVNLGVGTLAPEWYSDDDPHASLAGFRRGDSSVGIHIPQGADLSRHALDRTFDEARGVLGETWPTNTRRLATCRSWMMDDRLLDSLRADSNLVLFLRRFELVPGVVDGDDDVVDFVFRLPGTALDDLPRRTSLERLVTSVLESGEHWYIRTGWFDFDRTSP